MARILRPRALRAKIHEAKNGDFLTFFGVRYLFWRAARAQVCARSENARQSIFLIKEMIFDYLIDILAQKAEILEKVEIW